MFFFNLCVGVCVYWSIHECVRHGVYCCVFVRARVYVCLCACVYVYMCMCMFAGPGLRSARLIVPAGCLVNVKREVWGFKIMQCSAMINGDNVKQSIALVVGGVDQLIGAPGQVLEHA